MKPLRQIVYFTALVEFQDRLRQKIVSTVTSKFIEKSKKGVLVKTNLRAILLTDFIKEGEYAVSSNPPKTTFISSVAVMNVVILQESYTDGHFRLDMKNILTCEQYS